MLFVFHFFDPKNSDPDGSESITLMKKNFPPSVHKVFYSSILVLEKSRNWILGYVMILIYYRYLLAIFGFNSDCKHLPIVINI